MNIYYCLTASCISVTHQQRTFLVTKAAFWLKPCKWDIRPTVETATPFISRPHSYENAMCYIIHLYWEGQPAVLIKDSSLFGLCLKGILYAFLPQYYSSVESINLHYSENIFGNQILFSVPLMYMDIFSNTALWTWIVMVPLQRGDQIGLDALCFS